jgi:branched-chain amino acid transport system permease protein
MNYIFDTAVQILFLVCLAASLNVLMGYAGQFSMATAAFYGVGAYTYSFMSSKAGAISLVGNRIIGPGWPFFPSLLVAIAASVVVGIIISWPAARRVKGDYIILLTLAFQYVLQQTAMTMGKITGGPQGLPVEPISFGGFVANHPSRGIIIVGAATVVILAISWLVGKWGFGRLLRGIRDDEEVVQSLGKGTILPKSAAFAISAGLAGCTGAIAVAYLMFVAPQTYSIDLAILVAACVALGGPGRTLGVAMAAVVLGAIQPVLTNLGMSGTSSAPWQYVIFGAILVLGIRFRPAGFIPEGAKRGHRGPASTNPAAASEPAGVEDATGAEMGRGDESEG